MGGESEGLGTIFFPSEALIIPARRFPYPHPPPHSDGRKIKKIVSMAGNEIVQIIRDEGVLKKPDNHVGPTSGVSWLSLLLGAAVPS